MVANDGNSFFTFAGMFLEVMSLSAYRRENGPLREKNGHGAAPATTAAV
jgi:hypothetical protein